MSRSIQELSDKIQIASSSTSGTENRIQDLVERIENIQEKMYDFEINKRNNLLFYGLKEERRETPSDLLTKVNVIRMQSGASVLKSPLHIYIQILLLGRVYLWLLYRTPNRNGAWLYYKATVTKLVWDLFKKASSVKCMLTSNAT